MRKKFSTASTETVTLSRGDESLTFTITAVPPGYSTSLEALIPFTTFVKGQSVELDHGRMEERKELRAFAILAKALEADGCLETQPPTSSASPEQWIAYAQAVREEMKAALLTEGEISHLVRTASRVSQGKNIIEEAERHLGN